MGEDSRVGPRGPLEREQSALGREGAKRELEPWLGLLMILISLPPLPDLEVENRGLWDDRLLHTHAGSPARLSAWESGYPVPWVAFGETPGQLFPPSKDERWTS